ncbi:MAG TPA: NAD(P)H-hydrate dehydratase [Planctomycetota bacterium]|nr:NAD(P)H-hydrate dehydratase [Planctomycetota bacterium]HRR78783.1 NAD(P)H-hydrate dehydratase [Planctomycetota bacterium]HRT96376.1 NAD(P)H-hydrate dehydratase [Planctomycetota bacterium]
MFDIGQDIERLVRPADAHKGQFGHVLVLAGSTGFAGAACLAAEAALRSGAGLVTLGVPASLLPVVAAKLTACMTHPFREVPGGAFALGALPDMLRFAARCDVVALGPGIGRHRSTQKLVHALIRSLGKPLVLDADGLNALEGCAEVLDAASAPVIITPHPGEMARLTGLATSAVQASRSEVALRFAREHSVITVLKGHRTVVSDGRQQYVSWSGNPGMATGGTGDVLTGMIAALLAQGLPPYSAAYLGVSLHGLAGDLAVERTGEQALTATDILAHIGAAFCEACGRAWNPKRSSG